MSHSSVVSKSLASVLVLLLAATAADASGPPLQAGALPAQSQAAQSAQAPAIPDAPSPHETLSSDQQDSSQSTPASSQNGVSTPLGTAAAPSENPVGTTGSKPAGAVIAPAKQRRVHMILIGVGVVLGTGIAIGTVAALSHGSPSQPH